MVVLTVIAFVKESYVHQCYFIIFPINTILKDIVFNYVSHSL